MGWGGGGPQKKYIGGIAGKGGAWTVGIFMVGLGKKEGVVFLRGREGC